MQKFISNLIKFVTVILISPIIVVGMVLGLVLTGLVVGVKLLEEFYEWCDNV